jgi:uncharacterized membrane protein YecN with MAPEG domain
MTVFFVCAGLLGLLATALTIHVGRLRVRKKIYLGDGGDPEMLSAIRAHANLIELTPLCLLLIYVMHGPYGNRLIAILAVVLLIARLLHAAGMLGMLRFGRSVGAVTTTVTLLVASALLALAGLGLKL